MPEYLHDVFISYAHIDNRPASGEREPGWVDFFRRTLDVFLSQRLGRSPRIWMDTKLAGSDYFSDVIEEQLAKSKVLVSVISPAYIRSDSCLKEVETFYRLAENAGGAVLTEKYSRLIPVVKSELPRELYPRQYQKLSGYNFYEIDERYRPREYSPAKDGYKHQKFLEMVSDLAWDIATLLKQIPEEAAGVEPPPAPQNGPRIFISYRREDTEGHTGRLFDRLSERFNPDNVFIDIDTIKPGVDFVDAFEEAVGSCNVLLAVIGKRWVTIADEVGDRRLDNPEDFVLLEITAALGRKIPIIPVLVQGATMPKSIELPEALKPLSRRQAVELSSTRWNYDVERLIKAIEEMFAPHSL